MPHVGAQRSTWAAAPHSLVVAPFLQLPVSEHFCDPDLRTHCPIHEVAITTSVSEVTAEYLHEGREHTLYDRDIPDYVRILRIHGAFLFGATHKLENIEVDSLPQVVILRLRNMTTIDSTGLKGLENFACEVQESGRGVILCGAREQPRRMMHRAEFQQHVNAENICENVARAFERARELHGQLQTAAATA
ncbi:MAG TPA: sodium-independent anion transporter [Terriglobales bacterium]